MKDLDRDELTEVGANRRPAAVLRAGEYHPSQVAVTSAGLPLPAALQAAAERAECAPTARSGSRSRSQ